MPQAAIEALTLFIADGPSSRLEILLSLIQLDMSHTVETLLTKFMNDSSEDEVTLAMKALAGYKVVNLGLFDEAKRAEIIQTCPVAMG